MATEIPLLHQLVNPYMDSVYDKTANAWNLKASQLDWAIFQSTYMEPLYFTGFRIAADDPWPSFFRIKGKHQQTYHFVPSTDDSIHYQKRLIVETLDDNYVSTKAILSDVSSWLGLTVYTISPDMTENSVHVTDTLTRLKSTKLLAFRILAGVSEKDCPVLDRIWI